MKRRARTRKEKGLREIDLSDISKDEEVRLLKLLIGIVKKKYNLSSADVLNLTQEEIMIPCTIFTKRLSPLETDVKYLKENLELDYTKIGELLGRNKKTIWQAHKNAAKKYPRMFKPEETEYNVPIYILKDDLSILEATVAYLKEEYKLSYHDIGELLQRNERTIWTVYHRAQKKKTS